MKKYREPLLLLLVMVLLIIPNVFQERPVDWSDDFEEDSKSPFGSLTVYQSLEDLFPGQPIGVNRLPLTYLNTDTFINHNLVFITGGGNQLGQLDLDKLIALADQGNHIWISAINFETSFLEMLDVEIEHALEWRRDSAEVYFIETQPVTKLLVPSREEFLFFSKFPKEATPKATRYPDQVTLLELKMGKGAIWLHINPRQLSNISLLESPKLVQSLLSLLPNQATIWDAYYKPKRRTSGDFLSFIRSQPALLTALYLAIGLVLLSFLFNSKRRQKAIPIVQAPVNRMKMFTESIAHLMLSEQERISFVRLKWKHFENDVRRRFQLTTNQPDFKEKLSNQSGWELEKIEQLFTIYIGLQNQNPDKASLLKLAYLIDEYYKLTKKEQ